jgi:hypothetical protein
MHKTKTSLPTNDGGIPRRMFHVFLLSTNNTCYQWHVLDTSNIYSIPYHLVTNEIITSKSLTYPFTKPSCPCFFPSQWHHQNPDPPPMTPSNYCWEEFWSLQVCCWPMEIIPFRWCRSILKKKHLWNHPLILFNSLYIYILYWYIYIYLYLYISNSMPFNPYPQSFGYPVNSVCTWPVSRTGFPTHGWSFPIHKGQLFINANINHCQYIYYIYTIIIYILLWLLLSYYIVYC